MLKNLIFIFLTWITFSAHAQNNSSYNVCMNTLMDSEFMANKSEAHTVCSQNSSPDFMKCMNQRAATSNIHVLDAAIRCSPRALNIPLQTQDPNYINFRSCPVKLQMRTGINNQRAQQICNWDSTPLVQNCIFDLIEKAQFHGEHAVQYCSFANREYRNKIPQFVTCLIDNANQGYDVYSRVLKCDREMLYGKPRRLEPQPHVEQHSVPQYDPNYTPPKQPDTNPTPIPAPEVKTPPSNEQPAPKPSTRKVPIPVEIKIEASSKPEVKDQPVETGSTSNSESLPL